MQIPLHPLFEPGKKKIKKKVLFGKLLCPKVSFPFFDLCPPPWQGRGCSGAGYHLFPKQPRAPSWQAARFAGELMIQGTSEGCLKLILKEMSWRFACTSEKGQGTGGEAGSWEIKALVFSRVKRDGGKNKISDTASLLSA